MKKGYWYLIGSAIAYGAMGILVRFIAKELGPLSQTFWRLVVSGLLSLGLVILTKTKIQLKSKQDVWWMLFMGIIGYGLSIIAYTYALQFAPLANVLFVFSGYPIISALLAAVLLREKLTKNNYIALVLLVVSLTLMFDPTNLATYFIGNSISVFVGLTFAFYIVASKRLSQNKINSLTISFLSIWLAVITSGIAMILFEPITFHVSAVTAIEIIGFGFLNFAGYSLLNAGFKYVSVATGTMILLLEPIVGSILGYMVFREIPSTLFILGASVMILSIYISTRNT